MTRPETRYTKAPGGGYVAYQLFGSGPAAVVFVTNWITNCDAMWEEPTLAAYFERLARFARVLCFDKRGTGVSDPVPLSDLPRLEEWMDDVRTVMDAAQLERAALLGDTEGGPMAMMFAASHPDRVSALALVNSFARWRRADDYPIGMPNETAEKLVDRYEQHYGVTSEILALTAPTLAHDARFARWFTRYQRLGMPPGAAATMYRWVTELDVRSILPSIRVPTLVLQRRDALHHRAAFGRYLAQQIPGAKYVELPGAETVPFSAGDFGPLLDEVEQFLTGARAVPVLNRQLATVMITDIVARRSSQPNAATPPGRNSSGSTTTSCANSSTPTVVVKSTIRATVSSPLSTARRGQLRAPLAWKRRSERLGSRSARESTQGKSSSSAERCGDSRSTSPPG